MPCGEAPPTLRARRVPVRPVVEEDVGEGKEESMGFEKHLRRRVRAVFAGFAVFVCFAGFVRALDFNDIVALKENQVSDTVIMNMIHGGGGVVLDANQEARLRGMGVSEAVLAAARASRPVPAQSPSIVVESPPQGAAVQPPAPVQVTEMAPLPALYAKEGWVSISNSGWESYYLLIDRGTKRMFLSQTPNGGIEIGSGQNQAVNVRKETYTMYGTNGRKLKVRVRENEVTRVTLSPFGMADGGGLTVSAQDRERVRAEVLFG
jgi:hypothetical protein